MATLKKKSFLTGDKFSKARKSTHFSINSEWPMHMDRVGSIMGFGVLIIILYCLIGCSGFEDRIFVFDTILVLSYSKYQ